MNYRSLFMIAVTSLLSSAIGIPSFAQTSDALADKAAELEKLRAQKSQGYVEEYQKKEKIFATTLEQNYYKDMKDQVSFIQSELKRLTGDNGIQFSEVELNYSGGITYLYPSRTSYSPNEIKPHIKQTFLLSDGRICSMYFGVEYIVQSDASLYLRYLTSGAIDCALNNKLVSADDFANKIPGTLKSLGYIYLLMGY